MTQATAELQRADSMKRWRDIREREAHVFKAAKFKGALCSFGEEIQTENLKIDNINETMMQTQKYSFFP